ncbi:TPA: DUF3927 family protein [Enterobacter ludwigii]|uniref:DUF3927 family protein n=1 Tax=Enterobacter TaxID=547 RepID=UPI0022368C2C|nr:DUF3927 family protein [Enterobacter mori]MCW4985673.1 DUF3927 family protein [Enterobacter mori]
MESIPAFARTGLLLFLAFMAIMTDFTSYLLSVASDAFFVSAILWLVWPSLKSN